MLQNRYGDREFPIRDRWSSARLYREGARRRSPGRAAARGLIWVAPAVIALIAATASLMSASSGLLSSEEETLFLGLLALFVVLVAVGLLVGTLVDRTMPRRELQR